MSLAVLTPEQRAEFDAQGFLPLRAAFPPGDARAMQEFLWRMLGSLWRVRRDDPTTWQVKNPRQALEASRRNRVYGPILSPRLSGAIDDLLGPDGWHVPDDWGYHLVTFPRCPEGGWAVPTEGWHWDFDPFTHTLAHHGVFVFTLFSEIRPQGGGTVMVSGSHRLIARWTHEHYPEARRDETHTKPAWDAFFQSHPWFAALTGQAPGPCGPTEIDGVPVRVVEITGDPGDAYFCHPLLLHAVAPHCGDTLRFMRARLIERVR